VLKHGSMGLSEICQANSRFRQYAAFALLTLVLLYAALAGLRTVTEADTGWQLASGRYIFEHHQIPSKDVLSYTARGEAWIYPPVSELILYVIYTVGGFAALSWMNAAACAATIGMTFWGEAGITAGLLATLAIPKIAYRTAPRADVFTTLLFTALLVILCRHYRGRRAPLWTVPIIFLIWANTHLGFIAGFALLIAYVVMELSESLLLSRREAALRRLRSAFPWLVAAVPVTLCNWWGWGIYGAVLRQERDMAAQQNVIAEWRHVPLNASTLAEALQWRNPNSSYFWLLALALLAAAIALKRQRFGPAALLVGATYLSLRHIRFQGLFATVAIVVATPYLASLFAPQASGEAEQKSRAQRRRDVAQSTTTISRLTRYKPAIVTAALLIGALLLAVRVHDLITQESYIADGDVNLFGAGLSAWYPERAAAFILRERLPGNVFHDYNLGGFLSFRLGPQYPDYVDGRALPFHDVIGEQRALLKQSPDSAAWELEADKRGINTLIFPLARHWGLPGSHLRQFCASHSWTPVYLDEVAIVLVRNHPENQAWLQRLAVDCQKVKFDPPATLISDNSSRGRAELFNFYAHAGSVLFKLSRTAEAEAELDRAIRMFPEEPFLHQIRGQVYQARAQLPEAEREYLESVRLKPAEATWYTLANLYSSERRYEDAAHALQQAADVSVHPSQYYVSLGTLYVSIRQPQKALSAFDAAAANTDFESPEIKAQIESQIAQGRARAWSESPATP
jgi:tetratricopeptide (TPR) repeat protein